MNVMNMMALAMNPTATRKGSQVLSSTPKVVGAECKVLSLENLFADREKRNNSYRRI